MFNQLFGQQMPGQRPQTMQRQPDMEQGGISLGGFPAQQGGAPHMMPPQMAPGGGNAPPPQTVGMVPGVPGSMGLNPAAQQGGISLGVFPASPQMHPTGGIMQPQQSQMQDWRQARPDHQGFAGSPQDWHSQMQDWRGQRPTNHFQSGSYMQPGGGLTQGGFMSLAQQQMPNGLFGMGR